MFEPSAVEKESWVSYLVAVDEDLIFDLCFQSQLK